jgi:hypothetical protein
MKLAKFACAAAFLFVTPVVLVGCGEVDVRIEINPTDAAGNQRESSVDIDFAIEDDPGTP